MNYKLITLIAIACFALMFINLYDLKTYQNWHRHLDFYGWIGLVGFVGCLITLVFVPLFMKRK